MWKNSYRHNQRSDHYLVGSSSFIKHYYTNQVPHDILNPFHNESAVIMHNELQPVNNLRISFSYVNITVSGS